METGGSCEKSLIYLCIEKFTPHHIQMQIVEKVKDEKTKKKRKKFNKIKQKRSERKKESE